MIGAARFDCPHESDVLTAVYTRRWPDRADEALRAHVATCEICRDLAAVSSAFEEECDDARGRVPVPDSRLVWWRAQLRARQDAARTVVRPITVAQAVALAVTVGVLGAVFGATAPWFQNGLRAAGALFSSWTLPAVPSSVMATLTGQWTLLVGATLALVLAPIAVYLAVRDE
jgi:hypothetical protein